MQSCTSNQLMLKTDLITGFHYARVRFWIMRQAWILPMGGIPAFCPTTAYMTPSVRNPSGWDTGLFAEHSCIGQGGIGCDAVADGCYAMVLAKSGEYHNPTQSAHCSPRKHIPPTHCISKASLVVCASTWEHYS